MLDPHIYTSLLPEGKARPVSGRIPYSRPTLRVQMFKFVLDYRRRSWTTLKADATVPVVPPRHDGYPRFLGAAWPYYASAISTSVGLSIFAALWLAGDGKKEHKKGKSIKPVKY